MGRNFSKIICFIFTISFLSGCSVTKHLDESQIVHVATNIIFSNPELINKKNQLESELLAIAQPQPAVGIKKWQTRMYNTLQKSKKQKGPINKYRKKNGKPPVLYEAKKVERSRRVLEKYLWDNGYFGATVKKEISENNQKLTVDYLVTSKGQYTLRNIDYPLEPAGLSSMLRSVIAKSLLQKGNPYKELDLTAERVRLATLANNYGYINVNQDQFYFFVDTTAEHQQVDIFLKVRQAIDSTTFQRYRLNNDVVFGNYSLTFRPEKGDTTVIDNSLIIQKNHIVRPEVLVDIIGGSKNDLYSKKRQDNTLARLLDLGIYKFVNLKFEKITTDSSFMYDRQFYLTPTLMQDVVTEFQVNTRSGNYFGIGTSVSYTHKNIFNGAEYLSLSLSGGLETQFTSVQKIINTADIGVQASITIPDFLLPFKIKKSTGGFVPRTLFSINGNYQERVGFYSSTNFSSQFGYEWNELADRRHSVFPINISQISVFNTTQEFDDLLLGNPRLSQSFENVFILGFKYKFVYNTSIKHALHPYSYFRLGLSTSGNLPSLISKLIDKNGEKPYQFLGTPYSQFTRIDVDYRYFIPRAKGLFASRFIGGVGVPYNNSTVLPFTEQFFAGGSNDIRSFTIRSLGPGSYQPDSTTTTDFLDQTGDIKLALNLEYRFPILSYLKGALFIDTGNTWLIKDVENNRPEGIFKFNRFYKEIALGTGFGLRLDFDFVVIRLDTAFPLRRPFVTNDKYWTFSEIDFSDKTWRQDNIVWNIAIGYPF